MAVTYPGFDLIHQKTFQQHGLSLIALHIWRQNGLAFRKHMSFVLRFLLALKRWKMGVELVDMSGPLYVYLAS